MPSELGYIAEQLAPVSVFAVIGWVITAWLDARIRGKLIASGASQELLRAILVSDEERRRLGALRWGIVLTCFAIGLAIMEALGWREPTPGAFAVLIGAAGVGNLGFFAATQLTRSGRRGDRDDAI